MFRVPLKSQAQGTSLFMRVLQQIKGVVTTPLICCSTLMNKLVPCAWLLSGTLNIFRLRTFLAVLGFGALYKCSLWMKEHDLFIESSYHIKYSTKTQLSLGH